MLICSRNHLDFQFMALRLEILCMNVYMLSLCIFVKSMRNVITFSLQSSSEKSACLCSAQESRVDMLGTMSPASVAPRHPALGQGLGAGS